MAGLHWTGIAAQEIESAMRLHRIPESEWTQLQDDVIYMGRIVAAARNKQAARRSN